MPFTQIDDMLCFDGEVVRATGTLVRPQDLDLNRDLHPNLNREIPIPPENVKTFWVRVCQAEHAAHATEVSADTAEGCEPAHPPTGLIANIAEGSASDESFLNRDGTWRLALPIRSGSRFVSGDAAVTATVVYEAGDDLFSLTWAECVRLEPC